VPAITELLDTTNGCWYTCDDLPVPHHQLKATVVNNSLYLLGGSSTTVDASITPSLQMFTASLDNLSSHQLKWQSFPDTPWCYSTSVVVFSKFLLTFGGRQPFDYSSQTSAVCYFNQLTGLWKQVTSIPAPRSFPAVACGADNRIIVVGGLTNPKKLSSDTWIGVFEYR